MQVWGLPGVTGSCGDYGALMACPPIPSGKVTLQVWLPVTDDRAVCLGLFLGLPRDSSPAHETGAAEAAGETRGGPSPA